MPLTESVFKEAAGYLEASKTDVGQIFFKYTGTVHAHNYLVLDTDYDHYSILWFCHDQGNAGSNHYAWVFSRTPTMDATVVDKVDAAITKYFTNKDKFHFTVQDATL